MVNLSLFWKQKIIMIIISPPPTIKAMIITAVTEFLFCIKYYVIHLTVWQLTQQYYKAGTIIIPLY